MAFIPVEDTVMCVCEGEIDGQTTINTLYFRSSTGPRSAADVIELAEAVASWYGSNLAQYFNVGWTGRSVRARGLTNEVAFQAEATLLGSVGAITGEAMPNSVSMAVKFSTGLTGRSSHGRNFVPALSDSMVDGNDLDATWVANVVSAYGELIFGGGALPGGWIWVVVSRFNNNEPRVTGTFQEIFSVGVSDLIVDSMRSRLPGRGR